MIGGREYTNQNDKSPNSIWSKVWRDKCCVCMRAYDQVPQYLSVKKWYR